jgi:hypothetical protein
VNYPFFDLDLDCKISHNPQVTGGGGFNFVFLLREESGVFWGCGLVVCGLVQFGLDVFTF